QVQSPETAGAAPVPAPTGQRGLGLRLRQFRTLSARSFALYRRNPSRAIPLFVQPLIFSVLLLALFRTGVFDTDNFNLSAPTQLLFIFTFTVFLFGLLWGIQEIVSEFSIFRRERLVNLGVIPYVLSKTAVLVPVMMFGITLMTGVLILTDRLPEAGFVEVYLPLWFTLFLMGLVGLSLALFSSAVAPSSQAATDMLSIWIMPQVLFSGAIFPVPEMALPGRVIALFVPLRWAFEGVARVLDLPAFYAASDSPIAESLLLQYESSFTRPILLNWSILAAFVVVPITVAIIVLARRTKV
ncbi:MAG TPA: ABC transporter permease, partial [Euzebya sp.]|nr:ABC transporter permease [Euzebya sp.]